MSFFHCSESSWCGTAIYIFYELKSYTIYLLLLGNTTQKTQTIEPKKGHIRSLENLIRLGACINLKNNNNESALHFAARYGRFNTVRQLLDSEKGTFIINECDGEGLTPLHIASKEGHTRVVQLLLNRGALLHRDHKGRNPFHLAAASGYTQTMELLYSVHSHLLDQVDKDGVNFVDIFVSYDLDSLVICDRFNSFRIRRYIWQLLKINQAPYHCCSQWIVSLSTITLI